MTKSGRSVMFSLFNFVSGTSACYFVRMIMLIRLLGTLAQTRVGVGRLHTLVWGSCVVKMSSLWQNPVTCVDVFYLNNYFWRLSLLFPWNNYAY